MVEGASDPTHRALSIDAAAPLNFGWTYVDDADASTPPCAIAGQPEWQPPIVMHKEDDRRVRIAAVARRTDGDRTGCEFAPGQERACPALTRTVIRLAAPIGTRRIDFNMPR